MRPVSFLKFLAYLLSILFLLSCSDPIFWVTSREEVVSKNNLPKDTQATGIVHMNNYYYATVGSSLWKRPASGGQWERITLPSHIANGVGVTGGKLFVGSYNGLFESTDGSTFSKVANSGNSAVYQVGSDVYFAVRSSALGQQDITKNTFSTTAQYKITGSFMGAGSQGVAGNNGIYNNTSGTTIANGRFSWLSGYNQGYLYADGIVGEWNGNWTRQVNTGQAASRGSAIFQLSNSWGPVKALFSVYGLGYFELYEDGGSLKVRTPISTVSNQDAYAVSDLAFSTITGFYEHNGTLFALTSRKGLWSLNNGTWAQE